MLFYWKNDTFKKLAADITIGDIPKVITWGQSVLCVGFRGEYILYDVRYSITLLTYFIILFNPVVMDSHRHIYIN